MATKGTSREIEVESADGVFDAYVALPAAGQGPGIIFAENDEFVSADDVKALSESLDAAVVGSRVLTYVGVQHAFLNEARPEVFDADTAAEAWRDIGSFLEAELR